MGLPHEIQYPPIIETHAVELTPMEENEIDVAVISIFACAVDPNAQHFPGTTLYESMDGGTNWKPVCEVPVRASMGWVTSALGSTSAVKGQWDVLNTCEIEFNNDTGFLQTYEGGDPDLRGNLLLIGNEAVIPETVTPLGGRRYQISKLSRGRRDTTVDTQPKGSRVIGLRQPGRIAYQIPISEVGLERRFKTVSPGGDLDAAQVSTITTVGKSYRPLWVPGVKKTRHVPATNDYTLEPFIVTRAPRPDLLSLLGFADPDPHDWLVQIKSPTPGVGVVDEFYVWDSESFVYTAAQQTASLGAPTAILQGNIARLNRHGVPGQLVSFI